MVAGGRKGEGTAPVSAPYRYGVQVSGKVSGSAIIRITCLPGTLACCHPDLRVGRGGETGGSQRRICLVANAPPSAVRNLFNVSRTHSRYTGRDHASIGSRWVSRER